MEYLIYSKIKDIAVQEGMINALGKVAASVHTADELIFIDAVNKHQLETIITCLQDYLHPVKLNKDDIIYIFYPYCINDLRMYPLKRKDRIRIKRWILPL